MYMYLKILLNQQLIRHKLKLAVFICKLPHIKKGKTRLFLFSHFLDYFQLVSYIEMHEFRQNTSNWIFKKISVKNWPYFTILTCFGFFLVQKVDSIKTLGIFPSFPSPLYFSLGWILCLLGLLENAFDMVPVQKVTFSRGMLLQIQLDILYM